MTKVGENPGKCPYVDISCLGDEFTSACRGKGGLSGVAGLLDEKDMAQVAHLKSKIREVDFAVIAPKLGCACSGVEDNVLSFRRGHQGKVLHPEAGHPHEAAAQLRLRRPVCRKIGRAHV